MKKAVIFTLLIAMPALAFQKAPQEFSVPNPRLLAEKAEKTPGLRMTALERSLKRELVKMRVSNPKKFFELQ
jgi:hypothetical protein